MAYENSIWLKSYDPDVRSEISIDNDSLPQCFEQVRREFPNLLAAHFLGISFTFDELMGHADRFARCLIDHGLGKGDVVGISLPNCPQYLIALIGTLKAGCMASGLSPLLAQGEMAHQLSDSGAKALVVMDALFEHRFLGIAGQMNDLKLVIVTGLLDFLPRYKQVLAKWLKKVPTGRLSPVPDKKVVPFMEVLSRYPASAPELDVGLEDPAFLQYTGGTTGVPKGAVCLHRNMLANVKQFYEWLQIEKGKDSILSAFPMFHIAGLFTATVGLAFGVTQILIPNPRDTKLISKQLGQFSPAWMANVPSLYLMLVAEPRFRKLDFSKLRYCVSGAAPFPVEGIRQLEGLVGAGKLIELYGMTETCVLLTCNPRKGTKKAGTVGLPLPSTKLRIVDLMDRETQVPIGEDGEIIGSGPQVMREYHNKPGETAFALREHDGEVWMHTGDIGHMDEDGYLTIVDRAKDMISVGGFKVFPREVEEKLYEHPAIEICAIVGVPNPERPETELVKLVVQKSSAFADKPDEEVRKDLQAFSRKHLAAYKVPRAIEFMTIPLTPAGKVDKKALR